MPRSLAAAARPYINSRSRSRGEVYYWSRAFRIESADTTSISATVEGGDDYDVSLAIDGNRLLVHCTCPYFFDRLDPCKHIWTAILAADERGTLVVPPDLRVEAEYVDDDTALPPPPPPAAPPAWQTFLSGVTAAAPPDPPSRALITGELIYVADLERSQMVRGLLVETMTRDRKKSGDWAKPKPLTISRGDVDRLPLAIDREILHLVAGASTSYGYSGPWEPSFASLPVPSTFTLNATLQRELVPRLCASGRLMLRLPPRPASPTGERPLVPIAWDDAACELQLRITGDAEGGYTVGFGVRCGGRDRPWSDAMFVTAALVLWGPAEPGGSLRFTTFDTGGGERWLAHLLHAGAVTVPPSEAGALAEALATSELTRVECPEELRATFVSEPPRPVLRVKRPGPGYSYGSYTGRLEATVAFRYGEHEIDAWSGENVRFDRERRVAHRRDRDAERAAIGRLQALGVKRMADWQTGGTRLDFAESMLPTVVRLLLAEGWNVEAEGRLYRRAASMSFDVRSGIDWFELHGQVDFDGVHAALPALLAAARRGDAFVPLGDGTFGMLPDEWLSRAGRIAAMGTPEGDHVRFKPAQAALLDAWLAAEPTASYDEAFARARAALASFEGIAPLDPPASFHGALRGYQRDALGWFDFLRRFGFGGCLADEMGLGKTVMVLAMLEGRRGELRSTAAPSRPPLAGGRERDAPPAAGAPSPVIRAFGREEPVGLFADKNRHGGSDSPDASSRPSLVVVPRSLVFNWRQEAARFAPGLRVLDYTGGGRREALARIAEHDLVITTYGTLRRDAGELKDVEFDYAILDESQAIKNRATSAAKASRLLKARHRLALSGTPVENHLGELWSLFDFLNPGMLGGAQLFQVASSAGRGKGQDDGSLELLSRGLRPFILRRTKEQVAAELPPRTEQTLYCDLEPRQRALYDELRNHYRASLLGKVSRIGLGRAKLQVLEALLRLRQAACHPGLIDHQRAAEPSAKLDLLVPRLQELVEDGRKVLVFSQFTSLLALLRDRLDDAGLAYEYLDGQTRDRAARVERFQSNGSPLFLVSLKAGGLGLNLTAAEYVFLLDPWWNPAVEAQAIDRAHRIGQTRPVFAFRLIARDTVEEKVLELQASKRQLADAIVRADESLIRDLRREDLELLLS